ncbi:MAG: pyridoxal phosphate-dependent aminotransferase [Candidatus Thorarchaeota archaeon]
MTKMTIANRLNQIAPSGIRKMFARAQGIPGVISLGIGQPNIPTPNGLVQLLIKAVEGGDNYYSPTPGTPKFREAVSEQNKRWYNLDYNPNGEIIATASGCEALYCALMTFIDPGDEVLVPDPSFLTYSRQVTLAGGKTVWMKPNDELKIDTSNMQDYISDKTKAIILNFPSNPTGELMTAEELQPIVDLAVDNDLIILSDEVYERCIFIDEPHVRVPKLDGAYERTLLLNSFSKTYCIPGWRIGYVAGLKEFVGPIEKMHSFVVANAPSAQQNALGEFINTQEADDFTINLSKILKERMELIVKGLNSIDGFSCRKPEGSFYVFPNVSNHPDFTNSMEFCELIFEKQKVALVPGGEFGPSGEGFIRGSFGSSSIDEINELIQRLKEL